MSNRSGQRRTLGYYLLNAYAALALLYLFAPIFVIVLFSFNQPKGNFNIVWQRFTLDNWREPFAETELTNALWTSLKIAAISMVAATAMGALVAIALSRYRFTGNAAVNLLLVLPLTTPEIVLGASLATMFLDRGVERGFWTVVIAHVMFSVSFVALTIKARLRGYDWTFEDAAMDLGATPWSTFRRVTFPLLIPAVLAAGLLAFALSIDDFIITFFNAGGGVITFPLQIFGASRVKLPPQINVLATMILLFSLVLMGGGAVLKARRDRA